MSVPARIVDEDVFEDGNIGHRPSIKGSYFPVTPVDSLQDLRSAMCLVLEEIGVKTEVHHYEVATAGQCESALSLKFKRSLSAPTICRP